MNNRLILMTVGTSLLGGGRKDLDEDELFEHLRVSDALPQELSYLSHLEGGGRVRLLASDSLEGRRAAHVIGRAIRELPRWKRFTLDGEVRDIPGLHAAAGSQQDFRERGIPNLLGELLSAAEEPEVLLNPTGGFKGAIPFVTIAASFTPQVSVHYLYETAPGIIELPHYPIGLDFALWHRESNLLEASSHHDVYLDDLDPRMRDVAREGDSFLPRLLRDRYNELLSTDPLQEFGLGVVRRLIPDGALRGPLEDLVRKIGPRIWLGDKLPMAADHALKHHHNLLEIAQLFLTPMCRWHPGFLTESERFVLLAGILLHDCGHTIDALPLDGGGPLVPLLPSEIRNLHHFLAYYRLTTPELREELGWCPQREDLAEAVALLCLYHRKRTGWDGDGTNRCPYLGLEFPSPLRHNGVTCVDLPKLVALLRLIDGCDNQSRRVGATIEMKAFEACLHRDGVTWRTLSEQLATAARQALGENPLASLLDRPQDGELWVERIRVASQLAREPGHPGLTLWDAAVRAIDNARIRDNQSVHFAKHEAVRWIRVRPGPQFSPRNLHFRVVLVPSDDPTLAANLDSREYAAQHAHAIESACLRDWIQDEVMAELQPSAAQYLCTRFPSGVRFQVDFLWEGGVPFGIRPEAP